MKHIAFIVWTCLAFPLWAVDPPTLPKEVTGAPGSFISVPAKTDCPQVRWYSPDHGLNVFPVHLLRDSKTAVVTAQQPGRYRLLAVVAHESEPSTFAVCTVVVGDAPGPGPTPPGPNPPTPPTDLLLAKLQKAYDGISDADKPKHAEALQGLYSECAKIAMDAKIKTAGDLYKVMSSASARLLPRDALRPLREVVQKELDQTFPTDAETKLTERHRQEIQGTLSHLATLMGRLK